jgi:hypothetical protein
VTPVKKKVAREKPKRTVLSSDGEKTCCSCTLAPLADNQLYARPDLRLEAFFRRCHLIFADRDGRRGVPAARVGDQLALRSCVEAADQNGHIRQPGSGRIRHHAVKRGADHLRAAGQSGKREKKERDESPVQYHANLYRVGE